MKIQTVPWLLFALVLFAACSETTFPDRRADDIFSEAAFLTIDDDLTLMKDTGVALDSVDGVFSLGWNQFVDPQSEEARVSGHAHAIAFNQSQPADLNHRAKAGGLDMGDVNLAFEGQEVALPKHRGRRGGVIYSLFRHRFDRGSIAELPFVGGATYTFAVSGSADFAATSVALTAPAELIRITSPSNGEVIDGNSDVAINWSGGGPDDVVIRVITGARRAPGERPMRHQRGNVIFETLTGNPGSYTLTAAAIDTLLGGTDNGGITVMVTQIISGEATHENGVLRTLMRNGDRVRLAIQ